MKISRYKIVTAFAVFCLVWPFSAIAGNLPVAKGKIRINAENLVIDNEKRCAEFSGKVKAVRENADLVSDRLRIYYKSGAKDTGMKGEGMKDNSLDRMVAEGNVTIKFDNNVAETGKAVYTAADRTLVLEGSGSKVTGPMGLMIGSRITIYMDDGRIKVQNPDVMVNSNDGGIK